VEETVRLTADNKGLPLPTQYLDNRILAPANRTIADKIIAELSPAQRAGLGISGLAARVWKEIAEASGGMRPPRMTPTRQMQEQLTDLTFRPRPHAPRPRRSGSAPLRARHRRRGQSRGDRRKEVRGMAQRPPARHPGDRAAMTGAITLAICLAILALAIGALLYERRTRRIGVTDYSSAPSWQCRNPDHRVLAHQAGFVAFACYVLRGRAIKTRCSRRGVGGFPVPPPGPRLTLKCGAQTLAGIQLKIN
jgi:hypothetical protein